MSSTTRKTVPKVPKTPIRGRKDQRQPLTPSLSAALGQLQLSNNNGGRTTPPAKSGTLGSKDADTSINPFLETSVPVGQSLKTTAIFGTSSRAPGSRPGSRAGSRPGSRAGSRPGSPNKRSKSASGTKNTVNLYGMETKLDVIDISEWPSNKKEKESSSKDPTPRKRSKSQTGARPRSMIDEYGDRYFMERNPHANVLSMTPPQSGSQGSSPAHLSRLASAAEIDPNGRILTFHQPPPVSTADPMLAAQRTHVAPLYASERAGSSSGPGTSGSSAATKARRLPTQPERVLDAPGILDDYYLNLLSWSGRNELAVGLEDNTYVWKASTGEASHLAECPEGRWVTSLDWSADGSFLAIGLSNGDVELWDPEAEKKLRTMSGHQAQVGSLSWNNHVLSSGCQDGSIWHHDVRVARHHQGTLLGHVAEVCGLKWRPDGLLLASGGNDNVVNIWDGRAGDADGEQRTAKWTKRNHTAAVKALAWCPWQDSLLATGGGTGDATVHFWNANTGARTASLTTPAQVTSIQFTPLAKEFMTTHGYPTNSVMVHSYPSLTKIGEIKDAHDSRVLYSAISPQGDVVVTGAGDENVKFWKLWEVPPKKPKHASKGSTSHVLTLR